MFCRSIQKKYRPAFLKAGRYFIDIEQVCKPGSVFDNNLSTRRVAAELQPPGRDRRAAVMPLCGVASDRVYIAAKSPPRWWALTPPFHPCHPRKGRRYLSVALSLKSPSAAVSSYPALRSPDFPREQPFGLSPLLSGLLDGCLFKSPEESILQRDAIGIGGDGAGKNHDRLYQRPDPDGRSGNTAGKKSAYQRNQNLDQTLLGIAQIKVVDTKISHKNSQKAGNQTGFLPVYRGCGVWIASLRIPLKTGLWTAGRGAGARIGRAMLLRI